MPNLRSVFGWMVVVGLVASGPGCDDDDDRVTVQTDGGAGNGGTPTLDGAVGPSGFGQDAAAGGDVGNGGQDVASNGAPDAGANGAPDAGANGGQDVAAVLPEDSEGVAVMMEVNASQIAAGVLATARAQDPAVRAHAQMMVSEHSIADQRLQQLMQRLGITGTDSPERQMLITSAESSMTILRAATGVAFDAAYVQSQVEMHQRVLVLLDSILIPGAQNVEVRSEFIVDRAAVAMHLAAAQALQTRDGGVSGTAGTADAGTD